MGRETAESRITGAGHAITAGIEKIIHHVAGERMGFVLVMVPLGRGGEAVMNSNLSRGKAERIMEALLEQREPDLYVANERRVS